MKTIRYPVSNFDAAASFSVLRPRHPALPLDCYLFCAAWHGEHTGDHIYGEHPDADHEKVFCMQHAGVIKATYSKADRDEMDRFKALEPIKTGDMVTIEGHGNYKFTLVGDYSDAGYFTKID